MSEEILEERTEAGNCEMCPGRTAGEAGRWGPAPGGKSVNCFGARRERLAKHLGGQPVPGGGEANARVDVGSRTHRFTKSFLCPPPRQTGDCIARRSRCLQAAWEVGQSGPVTEGGQGSQVRGPSVHQAPNARTEGGGAEVPRGTELRKPTPANSAAGDAVNLMPRSSAGQWSRNKFYDTT